ncbi:hypothetical protein P7M26_24360 [Vibrio parahaemolyticus]|uniref:hypothetical protein n=1 Tax=Vibrio parahaemolyticus TaxID=670 RepID=UPI0032970901|nr:hypothetical protein [Vibrio parahaemolyticus]
MQLVTLHFALTSKLKLENATNFQWSLMNKAKKFILLLLIGASVGCQNANWSSISRETKLPAASTNRNASTVIGEGKAIHLDAQQRLVIINGLQEYCAEPSPDAISAFVSSVAASANVEKKVNVAMAALTGNSVSSIGLRTQSITMMRDSLYRMCEAYANGNLGKHQVANLIARSQNMAMVFLAIEQLTGAVIAQQSYITVNGTNNSASSLLTTQELLDKAREKESQAKTEMNSSKEALDKSNDKNPDYGSLKSAYDLAKQRYEDAQENVSLLETQKDSLTASVSNSINSSASFTSTIPQAVRLSDSSTQHIAETIESLVSQALQKDYMVETCLNLITDGNLSPSGESLCNTVLIETNNVLSKSIAASKTKNSLEFRRLFKRNSNFNKKVRQWLSVTYGDKVTLSELLLEPEYESARDLLLTSHNNGA